MLGRNDGWELVAWNDEAEGGRGWLEKDSWQQGMRDGVAAGGMAVTKGRLVAGKNV